VDVGWAAKKLNLAKFLENRHMSSRVKKDFRFNALIASIIRAMGNANQTVIKYKRIIHKNSILLINVIHTAYLPNLPLLILASF
jgi:hypothetical protein